MLKKVVLITQLLIIGILFNACNLVDREEANPKMDKTFFFEDITIREIAGTREKYKIDSFEDKAEDEGNNDSLDNLLDSLHLVATVKLDYNNEKNLFKLMKGTFYNINVEFKTGKAYDSNLSFNLSMQNIDKSDSSSILLDQAVISDINETGEYSLNIEMLMPDDINLSEGKYILLVDITGTDVNRSNEKLDSMEDLKKLQYIGGFYFELEDKDEAKTIDIVDAISEEYLDLPIDMTFKDGHTNDFLGKTTLIIYSTVAEETPLNVHGIMEVDGTKYPLRLLDTNDGLIKEKVVLNIPTFDGNNIAGGDRDLSYYLDKTSYEAILKKAPDLSTNIDSDGIEGKITWYIDTNNTDIETNDIEESVLISKYLKNFTLEDNFNVENPTIEKTTKITTSKVNDLILASSEYQITETRSVFPIANQQYINDKGWSNISKLGLRSSTIDAALDYDKTYVYLFSGNRFIKYNKQTSKIEGSSINLKDKWPKLEFDSIDAAFRWKDELYLFSGQKYARYRPSEGNYFKTFPNLDNWPSQLGKFAPFDAAVRGTKDTDVIYFLKGDKTLKFNYQKHKSSEPQSISSFLDSKYEGFTSGLSAISHIENQQKILFRLKESFSSQLINEGILFKYNAGFNKLYGNKNKFSVIFKSNNGVQAKWSLPSINVESKSNIHFNIYNKIRVNLLELDIQGGIGIRKTHPNYKADDDGIRKKAKTGNYGASARLAILGSNIIESGNMEEEEITESLVPKDAKEELGKAEKEGKNKKRSLKIPTYKWEEEKTLFEHNFFTQTGVPLKAEFGIEGSFKIEPNFDIVGPGLQLTLETPLAVAAFVRGSIDIKVAEVGVAAKLNMIETGGEASVGAGLRINDKNELQIVGEGEVKCYLRLINGEFNIFGKIARPYFIGIAWKEKTWNIYTTPWLYNREWTLLDYKVGTTILHLGKGI